MPRLLAAAAVAVAVSAGVAAASFSGQATGGGLGVSTATLQPPSGLTASRGTCVLLTSTSVDLVWTASPSTFTDGYEVLRATSPGGPYSTVGTTALLVYTDTTVAFSTTYHYVVRATKLNWRSVDSNESSVTTHTSLCL